MQPKKRMTTTLAGDERGSMTITVMISFLLAASLLGATTVMVPVLWRNTTAYGRQMLATQAAESGLQHTMAWVTKNGLAKFDDAYPHTLGREQHSIGDDPKAWFMVEKKNGRLISTGSYEGVKRSVSVMVTSGYPTAAVYAGASEKGHPLPLEMQGSAIVDGDVAINAREEGSVSLGWSPRITGGLSMGPGADPAEVIVTRNPGLKSELVERSRNHEAQRVFAPPEFPTFPHYPESKDSIITNTDKTWVSESGYYPKIKIQSDRKLIFDVTAGDLHIRTDQLLIEQGQIRLKGSHKLYLYVGDVFKLTGSSTVNADREDSRPVDPSDVTLYYAGTETVRVEGDTRFVGAFHSSQADLELMNSGGLEGSIISGGKNVTISGAASAFARIIYAPNAHLRFLGSGSVTGSLVANTVYMDGGTKVTYAPADTSDLGIPAFLSYKGWRVDNP